jgi:multiple sugar transport system permease protein
MAITTSVETPSPAAAASRRIVARDTGHRRTRPGSSRSRMTLTARRNRKSPLLTAAMVLMLIYSLLPLFWLLVNATKTQADLFSSFGLWFTEPFALWDNVVGVFTYRDGVYGQWMLNTLMYVVLGAGGSTLIASLAGYGLAKFAFPGKKLVFALVLGAIAIPGTALTVPTFLMFSELGLVNTPLAVILPSLISPFGMFLVWTYAQDAVPNELLEAARMDGAGEFRTFFTISLRLLAPGIVSVLLLEVVGMWNNYFLPLIMLSDPKYYPLTVGLNQWNDRASNPDGGDTIFNLVITGSLIMIIPIIIAFLLLQRYWQAGLTSGAVKQ